MMSAEEARRRQRDYEISRDLWRQRCVETGIIEAKAIRKVTKFGATKAEPT
jgi:hypothetical protein